jgi:hypothetical protein
VTASLGVPASRRGGEGIVVDLVQSPGGWWAGTATVPAVGTYPTWRVFDVRSVDSAGNELRLGESQLDAAGLSPRLTVIRPANSIAPEVQAFRATRRVDVRRHPADVVFRAHVTDPDEAATARVTVNDVALQRVSGTASDGWWRGRLRVLPGTASGKHRLILRMYDADQAARVAWSRPLRDHGHDWRYVVRSRPDASAPSLHRVVAPTTLDVVDQDRTVRVRLHVVDAGTGTSTVHVARLDDARGSWAGVWARRTAGTRRDGWWVAHLPFSRCTTGAGEHEVVASVTDRVGNTSTVAVASFEAVVGDHRGPLPSVHGFGLHEEPAGPLVVTFDEPAFGVTGDSLVLMHEGARVGGTWTCWDPNSTAVDCVAGPVLRAELVTSERPVPATIYDLVVNPEHTLDLTDALGNPSVPRDERKWFVWPADV